MSLNLKQMAPEGVMIAGGGRAILLQIAHPSVGYGVARHSSFAKDPLKRLHGTLTYIYALTNGTPQQAKKVVEWVSRAHEPVQSPGGPDHPAYNASDPDLQLWVAATLYDSAILVYENMFGRLSRADADTIYCEYAVLGTALGMPAEKWPGSRAEFREYWYDAAAQLTVDAPVREVAAELMRPQNAPPYVKALLPIARILTAGMLPPTLREAYGSWVFGGAYGTKQDLVYRALMASGGVVLPTLPLSARQAPMRYYLRRLGGNLPTIEA